jgi:hypothetical protein
MGKMLVEVDMFEGLLVELEVEWHGTMVLKRLDYMGVSFRCIVCKKT